MSYAVQEVTIGFSMDACKICYSIQMSHVYSEKKHCKLKEKEDSQGNLKSFNAEINKYCSLPEAPQEANVFKLYY